jgi:hypothetical protein
MRTWAVRRARAIAIALLAACVSAACADGGGIKREYEYEEQLYLALDGSATLNVNASVASLVALRGADLDPDPRARIDRALVRELFEGEGARASVSLARRDGRRFVHVTVTVDDVTQLSRLAPFSWSSYRFDRRGDLLQFRQVVGAPPRGSRPALDFTGGEIVAFRMHLPSEVRFHNAPSGAVQRGNILEWEQPLSDRLAGKPVDIEVHLAPDSILYTTMMLFGSTVIAAAVAMAIAIWWIARRGRDGEAPQPPRAPARERA